MDSRVTIHGSVDAIMNTLMNIGDRVSSIKIDVTLKELSHDEVPSHVYDRCTHEEAVSDNAHDENSDDTSELDDSNTSDEILEKDVVVEPDVKTRLRDELEKIYNRGMLIGAHQKGIPKGAIYDFLDFAEEINAPGIPKSYDGTVPGLADQTTSVLKANDLTDYRFTNQDDLPMSRQKGPYKWILEKVRIPAKDLIQDTAD